jgi:hypothetical protein
MDEILLIARGAFRVGVVVTTTRNWLWLLVRVVWIVVGMVQGPWLVNALDPRQFPDPSWSFGIILIAIATVAVILVVGALSVQQKADTRWPWPTWFENPFGIDRPVSLFDAGSYYVLAAGLSAAALELRATPRTWAWELPMSFGVGLWLGARCCRMLFRKRFDAPPRS